MKDEDLRFVLASAISYKMMHDKLVELAKKQTKEEQEEAEEFYVDFGYTLSLEIIDKINLAEAIGENHTQRLYAFIEDQKDYNIFTLLIEPNAKDGVRFRTVENIQSMIDKKYVVYDMRKSSVYQRFDVLEKLKEHFYPGDELFNYAPEMNVEEAMALAQRILANPNANDMEKGEFYPKFRQEIENIIGKENCMYDFWEFGGKESSLFWFIRMEVYASAMKKISDWLKYLEIDNLVKFEIKQDVPKNT